MRTPEDYSIEIAKALATPGGHLLIGHNGAVLYYENVSYSGMDEDEIKAQALAAGLAVIDSRKVPFDDLWRVVVRGPMSAVNRKPDEPPYHSLSSAPLAHVAALYRTAGAEVHNIKEG